MPKIIFEKFKASDPIVIHPQTIAFLNNLTKLLKFEDKGNATYVTYIGSKG